MSVIIKTMTNLPEYCFDCPCHDGDRSYCQADGGHRNSNYRPFWCPLIEIREEPDSCDFCSMIYPDADVENIILKRGKITYSNGFITIDDERKYYLITGLGYICNIKFCPYCGRKLVENED